ncbi:hypothetical protein [Candidatus Scalindua japonica]|uniref:hypothetical protein n=1 Tax=Candidatus Scalindua japonica TaxID=1284222 RepID=UPI000BDEEEEC|nr:hypothetical protein [Candidatus Scalindua japonica]
MKRTVTSIVLIVFIGLVIGFCTNSVTTFANDHATGNCAQCGEPNDGHVGAITVEYDGEHQTFCCPSCATKYANAHQEGIHHQGKGHHEHDDHGKHKGHDEHQDHGKHKGHDH